MKIQISANELLNSRINFPKKSGIYDYLPPFNSLMHIYLGLQSNHFTVVNLINSGNGNARLNSKEFKIWAEVNKLTVNDILTIELIDMFKIRISKN